ncbi:MAG TPA: hypothetical protein VNO30_34725 [Kofleriaceae bacterium]|nr:hypothetical protein [Kofleriaceae bacterium]
MSVRFWLGLIVSSALALPALADAPAKAIPAQAPAAPLAVSCDFVEISATKGKAAGPSIDPKLGPVEKKLKKAPFSPQWNEFKLLAQATKKLEKKKTEPIALKQGAATATLVETVDKSKVRITVTIDNAKGKQVVNQTTLLDAGDYVIHTQVLPPNDDGHLLAVTCK